jgi:hypothetical protein
MLTGSFSDESISLMMLHQIGDVGEASRLRTIAEHGDVPFRSTCDMNAEPRDCVRACAAVVLKMHDSRVDPVIAVIRHRRGFGEALGPRRDAARPDRG